MMNEKFTVEETNLICAFSHHRRDALIAALEAALPGFEEQEMAELAKAVLNRIHGMTDAEFDASNFYPEFGDEDEGQEE
jgi:exopolyphosphatase/pppGpp-phosphohydrolase